MDVPAGVCAKKKMSVKFCVSGNYSIKVAGISRNDHITRRLVRDFSVR